jgi:hypothetical protein
MFGDGRALTSDEIVIDPVVPEVARRALADMHAADQREPRGSHRQPGQSRQVRQTVRVAQAERPRLGAVVSLATGGQLIPFGQSPPAPPPPTLTATRKALTRGAFALAFLIGTLIAAAVGSIGFVVILLIATAIATVGSVRTSFDASSASRAWAWEQWNIRHAAVHWHRRYVVPRTDLDDEAQPIWARAVAAANEISESYVVQQDVVDSVQVAKALPQRLWEIVEGFASLSQARERQREILRLGGSDGRLVAAKVSAQDRRMKVEARRLEGRVRRLEEIADLLREADAVKRSEAVLGRLGEVDGLLGDLSARSAGTSPDLDPTERLRLEARAVIDQANEAARDLALPDLGEAEEGEEADDA